MQSQEKTIVAGPQSLDHDLTRHFPDLISFESTEQLHASPVFAPFRAEVDRILSTVVLGAPAAASGHVPSTKIVRALAWNLERGNKLDGILDALRFDELLKYRDVLLLTELDYGMARSGNRAIAHEIATALKMNYAFAPVYIALQKGSGVEAEVEGENTFSIHGLAMFSPWKLTNVHAVPLANGKDKMIGKEKRLGWLRALVADIEHPAGTFRAVTVHLDVHCSREHRRRQMRRIVEHLEGLPRLPTLIGGDWNTTTFNAQTAGHAILGYARRVLMGIRNVAKHHFPHPDRYFEKGMFNDLARHGYEYKTLNDHGVGTLHYHVESIEKNTNLGDWVPEWCFKFIFWAARRVGGSVSVKLDWFAGRDLSIAPGTRPATAQELRGEDGEPLSDHDAITVEFVLDSKYGSSLLPDA